MKRRFWLGVAGLAGGFLLLFGLRLGYGYWSQPEGEVSDGYDGGGTVDFAFERKNYASKKMARPSGTTAPQVVDQKYEKVASLSLVSGAFGEDERRVRAAVDERNGLVQFEQRSGLDGRRVLHLAIGVEPARFDDLVAALRVVGDLRDVQVHKVDKTNEFKELRAQQEALGKTRDGLAGLKSPDSGSLEERIRLEEQILAIEERIQALGVDLGEFDAENEFCTVKLTLAEKRPASAFHFPFLQRARVALEWTAPLYARLVATAAAAVVFLLLGVFLLERLARVPGLLRRLAS